MFIRIFIFISILLTATALFSDQKETSTRTNRSRNASSHRDSTDLLRLRGTADGFVPGEEFYASIQSLTFSLRFSRRQNWRCHPHACASSSIPTVVSVSIAFERQSRAGIGRQQTTPLTGSRPSTLDARLLTSPIRPHYWALQAAHRWDQRRYNICGRRHRPDHQSPWPRSANPICNPFHVARRLSRAKRQSLSLIQTLGSDSITSLRKAAL